MSESQKEASRLINDIERLVSDLLRKAERLQELVDEAYEEGQEDVE